MSAPDTLTSLATAVAKALRSDAKLTVAAQRGALRHAPAVMPTRGDDVPGVLVWACGDTGPSTVSAVAQAMTKARLSYLWAGDRALMLLP